MRTAMQVLFSAIVLVVSLFVSAYAEVRTTVSGDGVAVQSQSGPESASVQTGTGGGGGGGGVICGGKSGFPITVDGCPEDWFALGMRPVITDEYGDFKPEGDLLNVWITDDGRDALFLAEFAAPPTETFFFFLDANSTSKTGCQVLGMGAEYGITIDPLRRSPSYIGDARDCGWGDADFPNALRVAVRDRFVEFAVPLDTLRKLATGALTKFSVLGMNDATPVGRYFLRGVGANVHGFLSVKGFCANFTTGQTVEIPAGQSAWNCPDFGFKARPGDQVFTGAAGVVLAPPRPKK